MPLQKCTIYVKEKILFSSNNIYSNIEEKAILPSVFCLDLSIIQEVPYLGSDSDILSVPQTVLNQNPG